jgi:hypothetical protein
MNMKKWRSAAVAAAAQFVVLAGCVPAMMAPTVTATPGPGKLPAVFASDHAACTAQANQQMAPAVQAANNQVAGTALLNVMTGAGQDAVALNTQATATVQQQYDASYSACMYARGDNVPPYYMQPVYTAEPEPMHHAKRRVVHKSSPSKAAASAPASGSGFVVPAASAPPSAGSGFVTPAPTMTTASGAAPATPSGQFAVPPPAHP